MDPDALVALAVAAFTDLSPDKVLTLSMDRPGLETYHSHLKISGLKVKVLDALARVCARERGEMVAIGLRMGKPIELILATNDAHPSDSMINHLTTICSLLKKISDKAFRLRVTKTDASEIDSIEMELDKLYQEFLLKVYRWSFDKLMVKHAKWWTVFEDFRTQSLEWEQRMGVVVGGRKQADVADLIGPYQSVFTDLGQFREISVALQSSLSECCQSEKVGLMEMKLLTTRWQWMIVLAKNILKHPTACEYWAAKVALNGELLPFPTHQINI